MDSVCTGYIGYAGTACAYADINCVREKVKSLSFFHLKKTKSRFQRQVALLKELEQKILEIKRYNFCAT